MNSKSDFGNSSSGDSQLVNAVRQVLRRGITTDLDMRGQYKIKNYPNTTADDELMNRAQIEALIGTQTSKSLAEINLANPLNANLDLTLTGNPENRALLVENGTLPNQVVNRQQLDGKMNASTTLDQVPQATGTVNLGNQLLSNVQSTDLPNHAATTNWVLNRALDEFVAPVQSDIFLNNTNFQLAAHTGLPDSFVTV